MHMPDLAALAEIARGLSARVETLSHTNEDLSRRLSANTAELHEQRLRADRTERAITRTRAWVAALAILALLMGFLFVQVEVTSSRLAGVVAAEREARVNGQCPLLALFLGSYHPERRAPGTSLEEYEAAFKVIRDSYADLHCAELPGGKATAPTDTPTPTP